MTPLIEVFKSSDLKNSNTNIIFRWVLKLSGPETLELGGFSFPFFSGCLQNGYIPVKETQNKKSDGTLFSQTFKVEESKVPSV